MAMLAAQAYLIASLNFFLASQNESERLSPDQTVALLYQMAEGEDMRSFQEYDQSFFVRSNENGVHLL